MAERRSTIVLFLLLVFSVSFTGCGDGSEEQGQNTDSQTVRVGAILPLTGPTAYLGQNERVGIQMALDDRPSDAQKNIEFVYEDSKGQAKVALSAMRKMLNFQNINVHLVTTTTPVMATLPAYKRSNQDVLVISQCMVPNATEGYPFAYRLYPTSDEETDLLASHAEEEEHQRIGALHIQNRFGEGGINAFKAKVSDYGGEVLLTESFGFENKAFRTTLEKFKDLNLDALIVYAYSTNFPTIYKQMQEVGLSLPVLANLDMALGDMQKKVDEEFLDRVVFPAPRYYYAENDSLINKFNQEARQRGKEPNVDMAYTYDMASILTRAIETADSNKPNAIGSAIRGLMPYEGVTGTIRLNENRDTRADMKLVHWQNGQIELVREQQETATELVGSVSR